jgi:SAM-dependent methyltransferase
MPEPARRSDNWQNAALYEQFVGRWSRRVAVDFLTWLALPQGLAWLDIGCGSGAISQTILARNAPRRLTCLDRSAGFAAATRANTQDKRSSFLVADGLSLPFARESFDAAVSGFVLNFLPDPQRAVQEQLRVLRHGGCVAAYVWDYAGKMEFMRYFWEAACALDPAACEIDEGLRFMICAPGPLTNLYEKAGLRSVAVRPIDTGLPSWAGRVRLRVT